MSGRPKATKATASARPAPPAIPDGLTTLVADEAHQVERLLVAASEDEKRGVQLVVDDLLAQVNGVMHAAQLAKIDADALPDLMLVRVGERLRVWVDVLKAGD